jgi:hypothetical protein
MTSILIWATAAILGAITGWPLSFAVPALLLDLHLNPPSRCRCGTNG